MPPYVTVGEDGPGPPEESRPLHRFPDTIGGLFDLVVLGRLDWLWPVADLAAIGTGAVPVGLEHDLSDAALAGALRDATPRLSIATDTLSAERLLRARAAGASTGSLIVPAAGVDTAGIHPLAAVLELGATLDTAERAGVFRDGVRGLSPDAACCWHYAGDGRFYRLTHREALVRVADQISTRPALPGDLAYVEAPRVGLSTRLALYAFIGDGDTATALGRDDRVSEDVCALRPHRSRRSRSPMARTRLRRAPRETTVPRDR